MKKKRMAVTAMVAVATAGTLLSLPLQTAATERTYELYPIPQSIQYQTGSYMLSDEVNVVYESGIDQETKDRLAEAARLSGITLSPTSDVVDNKTNILVGIKGDTDNKVDDYVTENVTMTDTDLLTKTDSYVMESDNNVITVLAKDADAAFYGMTTLYHIMDQIEDKSIRNFQIEDYADIVSRGFIEGYYGNPWSTEDRIKLMEWGGYYKLNSYFYAPKNDPKHNAQWRELYTEQEIEELIKPLAEAGNRSKCRFVYALHPYMYNAIRHNTEENYQADLAIMQAKFDQVIEAGVRQISILADDAANVGGDNYIRMLQDMTTWLEQKRTEYPDLKMTLPFVTQEYMYNGESYYQNFPANVQIVMTGGRIWGEVSQSFTTTFTTNAGRGPYLWINWPCTDNSKKHLIMAGYSNFLHPNVDPEKVEGIVLNPMQQSEPSKVAIFGNAAYSWNIWESEEIANKAWEASFKYVDGNSAAETEASTALRELSKHMINQAMDGRVVALQESVELKELLTPFKDKLTNHAEITEAEIDAIKAEFEKLQQAAVTYREKANDTRIRDQIVYWLDCWDDTTEATLAYLEGIRDVLTEDKSGLVDNYIRGEAAFTASKDHPLWYLDHYEYAEVGVQHIVPFIKAMDTYLSKKALEAVDPSAVTYTYISNEYTTPYSGSPEDVLDGDDSTAMVFHEPNYVTTGQYIGLQFSAPITLNNVRFALGGGKNHFYYSKLEYQTADSEEWKAVNDQIYERPQNSEEPITATELGLENVVAVRLLATRDNNIDSWLNIKSIDINKEVESAPADPLTAVATTNNSNVAIASGNVGNVTDGNLSTELWLKNTSGDNIPADAAVTVDLGEVKVIGSVYVAQDTARANGRDILSKGVVEYSVDNNTWYTFGALTEENEQTILGGATARYVRVRNTEQKNVWWRLSEIQVFSAEDSPLSMAVSLIDLEVGNHNSVNDASKNNKPEYIVDGDMTTLAWLAGSDNGNIPAGGGVEIMLSKETELTGINIVQADGSGDKVTNLTASYQDSEGNWHELGMKTNVGDNTVFSFSAVKAKAIRLVNSGSATNAWWKLYEVSLIQASQGKEGVVYTNSVNASTFGGNVNSTGATLSSGMITLAPGEYIGLDVQNIQTIESLTVAGEGIASAQLEISHNGMQWESIENTDAAAKKTARYVRLHNAGTEDLALEIEAFSLTFYTIGQLGELISSNIPVAASWGDDRNNLKAFDGDMTTYQKFGGNPQAGNTAVYSLGQEIDVESIRVYTTDGTQDYIRDAKIQLSMDGETWEDALTIGDGTTDTEPTSTMGSGALGESDSNYPNVRYYGQDGINKKARFMRLYITANFPGRAIIINEIVINGGAYISEESNAAFSGTLEAEGYKPSNMLDKNLSTSYKASEANGSLTYAVSEAGVLSFRMIQSGEITGATIKAKVLDADNTEETVEVGTLADSINDFQIPEGKELAAIVIEWQEKIPAIAELILIKDEQKPTAPSAAAATEVTANSAKLTWTAATDNGRIGKYEIYQESSLIAIVDGSATETVLKNLDAETAYTWELYAYDSAGNCSESCQVSFTTLKEDSSGGGDEGGDEGNDNEAIEEYKQQLTALIAEAKEKIASDNYTEATVTALQAEVTKAENLMKEAAPTAAALQQSVTDLDNALKALKEKTTDSPDSTDDTTAEKQQLTTLIGQAKEKIASGKYTEATVKALQTEVTKAENLLKQTAPTAAALKQSITAMNNAIKALAEKTDDGSAAYKKQLTTLISQAKEKIASKKYTEATVTKLQAEVTKAEALLKEAAPTAAKLQQSVNSLNTAVKALVEKAETVEKKWIFTDVKVITGNWKYESVKYVYNKDIMGAVTGTTEFQPDRPLNRAMFATVLYRMAGEPKVTFENKFTDVVAGKWYSNAILWAYQNKIVSGFSDGSYGIEANITREQIAKMLNEYAKLCKYDISQKNALNEFTDAASVSNWAVEYMQWATAVKMISGKPNGDGSFRLDPKGEATRAECAAMLQRFANKYIP